MDSPTNRLALLEELAAVAHSCRHRVTGSSADARRFQELVAALWASEQDADAALLSALRGPAVHEDTLYRRAAALIPV